MWAGMPELDMTWEYLLYVPLTRFCAHMARMKAGAIRRRYNGSKKGKNTISEPLRAVALRYAARLGIKRITGPVRHRSGASRHSMSGGRASG